MAWVRVDDQFPDHPKVIALDLASSGLWLHGLCYANRHLTDGFVPAALVRRVGDETAEAAAARLVSAGLWEPVDGGWVVHDYAEYQRSREEIESVSGKRAEAGRAGGMAKAKQTASNRQANGWQVASNDLANAEQSEANAEQNPAPTPTPTPVENGSLRSLAATSRGKATDPPGFAAFWAAYPRNQDRKAAVEEWRRIKPDDDAQAAILAGLERAKRDEGFAGGQYAPYAVRWLKHRRWEDGDPPARGGTERLSPNSARRNRVVV